MLQGFSGAGCVYQPHPGGVGPGRSRRLISSGTAQCATAAAATSAALRGALAPHLVARGDDEVDLEGGLGDWLRKAYHCPRCTSRSAFRPKRSKSRSRRRGRRRPEAGGDG